MARVTGTRNGDYDESKRRLLATLSAAAQQGDIAALSHRELAAVAKVSVATLRHYFGSRSELFAELMAFMHEQGAMHLEQAATRPIDDVNESLDWLLRSIVLGWKFGVAGLHRFGLVAGMGDPQLGPAYVNHILEPALQACEARLSRHIANGQLAPCDVRHAALRLISPLLLGLIHQDGLFGSTCRPLDLDAFLDDLRSHFIASLASPR